MLQQVDTPQNLFKYPVHLFVAGFIGSPAMQWPQGGQQDADAVPALAAISAGGAPEASQSGSTAWRRS